MRKPYYVCGGLQDNGSVVRTERGAQQGWASSTDWYRIGGGDGFYTANDPRDWTIGYSESQDGNTNRYDLRNGATAPSGRAVRTAGSGGVAARRRRGAGRLERRRGGGAGGGSRRGGRGTRGGGGNVVPRHRRARTSASTGARRSSCRRTTRTTVYLGGDRLFKSTDARRHVDERRRI